jgi:hypothetical protein
MEAIRHCPIEFSQLMAGLRQAAEKGIDWDGIRD